MKTKNILMKIVRVEIHKYKSYIESQIFDVQEGVTVLVGTNESGKTAALEAIAKTHYFDTADKNFKYDLTLDYPRTELKRIKRSGIDPKAVTVTYRISDLLVDRIEQDFGGVKVSSKEFSVGYKYNGGSTWTCEGMLDFDKALSVLSQAAGCTDKNTISRLKQVTSEKEFTELQADIDDSQTIEPLRKFFKNGSNWANTPLVEYLMRTHLSPARPKCLYYDEYYSLPGRISIEDLNSGSLKDESAKTAKALFELADIDTKELIGSADFERFTAELEATEAIISQELFKYWSTNKNLSITFKIDKREKTENSNSRKIVEHILDIRVKNKFVSLPLHNRSKGFNWFFSFLVWFNKIQEEGSNNYILLLDEPGLNLHATAQSDLLQFISDLTEDYQVIYTTHSPFMINSSELGSVRTVFETDATSTISDSIQQKDPKTLFPLQAALGYDIAQNLFISKRNLLVEGVSDLIFIEAMSGMLLAAGKEGLNESITIVPVGGLDKVGSFISLLRGSNLKLVCLLDNFTDQKAQARLDQLVIQRIVKQSNIRFFNEYVGREGPADLEDMFAKDEYLAMFNIAFDEHANIEMATLDPNRPRIIEQINTVIAKRRYNHYRPASTFVTRSPDHFNLSVDTLERFENMFKAINKLF